LPEWPGFPAFAPESAPRYGERLRRRLSSTAIATSEGGQNIAKTSAPVFLVLAILAILAILAM
jgi:hypothetical protein